MARILFLISMRNLLAHKTSSFIVGSIIFFGTFLVVVGMSMLDSINASMANSITSSIAGHLQIYSSDAKDDLTLFGGGFLGGNDFGLIDNFEPVRKSVEAPTERQSGRADGHQVELGAAGQRDRSDPGGVTGGRPRRRRSR